MPKMKTHSGAKKRFKATGSGKIRGRHSHSSHILEKKSPKRKRSFGVARILTGHDEPRVRHMIGAKPKSKKKGKS